DAASGMLNALGLQTPGVKEIVKTEIPFLKQFDIPIIANLADSTVEEYAYVAEQLNESADLSAMELHISWPNVREGGIQFRIDPYMAAHVTEKVKHISDVPVYVKLSPNVTNIVTMAKAIDQAGADGLTMI